MSDADRSDFEAAIAAIREAPENDDAWEQVETLAGTLDEPEAVAKLYREVLSGEVSPDLANSLGERATGFYDEWFGDDPARLAEVLARVLELCPQADWAFQGLLWL